MKTQLLAITFGSVVLFCLLVLFAVRYMESLHADRTAVLAVQPNMTRAQVVESLGVLYDDYKVGQYQEVDEMVSRMEQAESIEFVCCWRIAYSLDRYWIGFDKDECVVATQMESKRP